MGLDQYLYIEKYDSAWRHEKDTSDEWKKKFYEPELGDLAATLLKSGFSKTIRYEVAYWRKENAIHKWFIDNYASGEDECQDIWISTDALKKLVCVCEQVLEKRTPEIAAKLLPTTDGFFFGSTDYDEWYFSGLEDTIRMLDPVIKFLDSPEGKDYDVMYSSSW